MSPCCTMLHCAAFTVLCIVVLCCIAFVLRLRASVLICARVCMRVRVCVCYDFLRCVVCAMCLSVCGVSGCE